MRLRAPLYVVWEVTLSCNARCIHCYSDAAYGRSPADHWQTAECLDLIDQLAAAGVIILGFSGGEVFLRPDWETLLHHAVQRDLRVTLGTNGLLITAARARRLAEIGVHNVSVSLDGASAPLHETIRGVPGIFAAACRAVERLRAAGVRVTVNFTPMRPNYRDAEAVAALACRLGANKVNLTEYVYLSRGGLDLMLGPDELRWVMERWLALGEVYRGRMEVDWHDCRVALLLPPEEGRRYQGCGAGFTHCRITHDKHVTPCVTLPLNVGSLRAASFAEIWAEAPLLARVRDRGNIRDGNCATCSHLAVCGGCRAVSMAHFGHPFGGDPTCWLYAEEG